MPFEAKSRLSHPGSAKSDAVTRRSHSSLCHGRGNGQLLVSLRSQRSTWPFQETGPTGILWQAEQPNELAQIGMERALNTLSPALPQRHCKLPWTQRCN